MRGRAIRIFLVDGTPTGLRTAEIGLSTIKGVISPRGSLNALGDRDESRRTGVYALVGDDPNVPGRLAIYIGEGDDVLRRILEHDRNPNKDFFDRVAIFVSKDQNLTKAHVRYLEAKLVSAARTARRATVMNATQPEGGLLPESDQSEMEEFLEQTKLLLVTLGVNVFESSAQLQSSKSEKSSGQDFYFSGNGYNATCRLAEGEFVVIKGSTARIDEAPSLSSSSKATRNELLESGVLIKTTNGLEFTQDYAFTSASGAAQVINAANVNGKISWKLLDGTTYKDWQEQSLPQDLGLDDIPF